MNRYNSVVDDKEVAVPSWQAGAGATSSARAAAMRPPWAVQEARHRQEQKLHDLCEQVQKRPHRQKQQLRGFGSEIVILYLFDDE